MLLIQKLYIKDFIKVLLILTFGMSAIFSTIGLIDRIDEFLAHKPSVTHLFFYSILAIPKYIHYLLPMAILLSSLFVFSQAVRRKEIIIIKSSTGRIRTVLKPFVLLGVLITILAFFNSEIIVPWSSKKMSEIKTIIKGKKRVKFKEGRFYMLDKKGYVVKASVYYPEKGILEGVDVFQFDDEGLKTRINAERAEWIGSVWILRNIKHYDILNGKITKIKEMEYKDIESPDIFQKDNWVTEEMPIFDLIAYQQRLKEAGFKNIKLIVDISSRLSYPLVNLFMLLLGISLSMEIDLSGHRLQGLISRKIGRKEIATGGIISVGLGLLICIMYWLGYSLFLSLGYAGTIPAFIAPWFMPVFLAVLAIYLYNLIPE